MKGKGLLAVVLLVTLAIAVKEAGCNVTLILPKGANFPITVAFCNDSGCVSQSFYNDYTINRIASGLQLNVPLHGVSRLQITFAYLNIISNVNISINTLMWVSNVVDGQSYTISPSKQPMINYLTSQLTGIQQFMQQQQPFQNMIKNMNTGISSSQVLPLTSGMQQQVQQPQQQIQQLNNQLQQLINQLQQQINKLNQLPS